MASNINTAVPITGTPTTASVRDNFATAKTEIEALQGNVQKWIVVTGVTGALTTATHSGKLLVTSGNIVIPNAAGDVGFNAVIVAGGAHTATFNGTTSPAMAAGDVMTIFVQGTTQIRAVLSAVADQVAFA